MLGLKTTAAAALVVMTVFRTAVTVMKDALNFLPMAQSGWILPLHRQQSTPFSCGHSVWTQWKREITRQTISWYMTLISATVARQAIC